MRAAFAQQEAVEGNAADFCSRAREAGVRSSQHSHCLRGCITCDSAHAYSLRKCCCALCVCCWHARRLQRHAAVGEISLGNKGLSLRVWPFRRDNCKRKSPDPEIAIAREDAAASEGASTALKKCSGAAACARPGEVHTGTTVHAETNT